MRRGTPGPLRQGAPAPRRLWERIAFFHARSDCASAGASTRATRQATGVAAAAGAVLRHFARCPRGSQNAFVVRQYSEAAVKAGSKTPRGRNEWVAGRPWGTEWACTLPAACHTHMLHGRPPPAGLPGRGRPAGLGLTALVRFRWAEGGIRGGRVGWDGRATAHSAQCARRTPGRPGGARPPTCLPASSLATSVASCSSVGAAGRRPGGRRSVPVRAGPAVPPRSAQEVRDHLRLVHRLRGSTRSAAQRSSTKSGPAWVYGTSNVGVTLPPTRHAPISQHHGGVLHRYYSPAHSPSGGQCGALWRTTLRTQPCNLRHFTPSLPTCSAQCWDTSATRSSLEAALAGSGCKGGGKHGQRSHVSGAAGAEHSSTVELAACQPGCWPRAHILLWRYLHMQRRRSTQLHKQHPAPLPQQPHPPMPGSRHKCFTQVMSVT